MHLSWHKILVVVSMLDSRSRRGRARGNSGGWNGRRGDGRRVLVERYRLPWALNDTDKGHKALCPLSPSTHPRIRTGTSSSESSCGVLSCRGCCRGTVHQERSHKPLDMRLLVDVQAWRRMAIVHSSCFSRRGQKDECIESSSRRPCIFIITDSFFIVA
jgi:hypothetical protein